MVELLETARRRILGSVLAQRFMRAAVWSIAGSVVSTGITLAMMMALARLLGKETYGKLVAVQSTLGMVGVFAGFGIGTVAIRFGAELCRHDTERLGRILALAERAVLVFGLVFSVGLYYGSEWMAAHLLNAPDLEVALSISAIAVMFSALDSFQKSVLIGLESMRAFAIGTAIAAAVSLPVVLLAASLYGLIGASVGVGVSALVQFCISRRQMLVELRKFVIKRNIKGCWGERSILWHFALPALLGGLLVSPSHWVINAMLANAPNGYAQLAVLGVAMQWFNVIMFLPGTAGRVVLPILTSQMTKSNERNASRILLYSMAANAIVSIPLAILISFFSREIMGLYGAAFANEYLSLVLVVVIATLVAVLSPIGNMIAAASRMWLGALMNAGWALVYVGLAYLLVSKGAVGVLFALGVGYAVHTVWVVLFAVKKVRGLA